MLDKVLILWASAGAGHLRAAEALQKAFTDLDAARSVEHIDTLTYTNKAFRDLYSKAYLQMVNHAPEALGWLYDQLDRPFRNERLRRAMNKLNLAPFIRMLQAQQPDVAVCTHFLPAEIISSLKAEGRVTCPLAIVVTDFDVHAMWLCRQYEHYFVALDETRVHLEKLGVPAAKITVSGIPIDPVFSQTLEPHVVREQLGLAKELPTVLLSAGGFGVGPVERLVTALLEVQQRVQVIAICGRNQELRQRVEAMVRALPRTHPVTLKPIGYTTEMDRYMSAADILLGKPGGLTSSEALAKGLAMVIVNPIPGQEERNADHLLEQGVAIRCNNLPALAYKLDRLLAQPARLAAMRAAALKLAKPQAARDVARKVAELAGAAAAE